MKIITIKQPWAHLIVSGGKDIENRDWPTKYRGPVLIHAGLAANRAACIDHGLDPQELERGGVVGIAEIIDCVTSHASRWFIGKYGLCYASGGSWISYLGPVHWVCAKYHKSCCVDFQSRSHATMARSR